MLCETEILKANEDATQWQELEVVMKWNIGAKHQSSPPIFMNHYVDLEQGL
jgi:hypothetical protein